jgi:hypothetical protein
MQEVLLFDRNRKPPVWLDLMHPGQYAVFLSDVETHVGMTSDGRCTGHDVPDTCLIFDSFDDATQYCRSTVQEMARLQCEVFDSQGKANPPVAVFVGPAFARTLESESKGRRQMWFGLILIVLSPPFFWLDWRADWGLIVPTFLGIQFILAGLRFIHLGYSTIEALRRSGQSEHAEKKGQAGKVVG